MKNDIRFLISNLSKEVSSKNLMKIIDNVKSIPQETTVADICISSRQFKRPTKIVDNLIFEISTKTSIYFGIWILACIKQNNYNQYTLVISNPYTDVNKIIFSIGENHNNTNIKNEFNWHPKNIEVFSSKPNYYCNSKPTIILTGKSKANLSGFGSIGGAYLIAEYFLNFGHQISSQVNYDYLKEHWANDILDDDSCEIRVQKIDAIKTNIFDEI